MTHASVLYLREHIRTEQPDARLLVWQSGLGSTSSWNIETRFNATTAVLVTEIKYEDLCEDFLDDDLAPAILWLRTGGQHISTTYKSAKATTKHINEIKQALKEI